LTCVGWPNLGAVRWSDHAYRPNRADRLRAAGRLNAARRKSAGRLLKRGQSSIGSPRFLRLSAGRRSLRYGEQDDHHVAATRQQPAQAHRLTCDGQRYLRHAARAGSGLGQLHRLPDRAGLNAPNPGLYRYLPSQ